MNPLEATARLVAVGRKGAARAVELEVDVEDLFRPEDNDGA